jgi:ribosomal protein L40E
VTAPQTAPTHACVRCGAPVAIDVGLCERCNPLGLRDSSSSQVHGIAIGGVILFVVILAVVGRFALSGIGPFEASVSAVPDGDALAVTLTVTNQGTSSGQTTCHVSDPADRSGNVGGFILSPRIEPGKTITFTQRLAELGPVVRPLEVRCSAP